MSRVFGGCRCGTPTSPIIQNSFHFTGLNLIWVVFEVLWMVSDEVFFVSLSATVFLQVYLFLCIYTMCFSTEFSGNVSATLCLVLALFNDDATWTTTKKKISQSKSKCRFDTTEKSAFRSKNDCRKMYADMVSVCQLHPPQAIRAQNKWRCSSTESCVLSHFAV